MADGCRGQNRSQGFPSQQGPLAAFGPFDAGGRDQGSRGGGRRRLFGDLPARRLRGECLGGGAADSRMLLSLFALQSARRRVGHRRSGAARPGRAAAQERGGQARGGETVHRPRRHRSELMLARERRGGNVMTSVLMRSACVAAIAAAGICGASAQQMIEPVSATPVPGPMPEILQKYTPVTAERLKNPEDGNWLMFRRSFDGWGYSPLGEITPANVSRLQPAWSFATGQVEGHEAPPVVNNGVMFVATPGNQLLALEARTGKLLWRYKRPFPEDMTPLHPTSRGVGLYGDKVYFAAAEAVLVAIDARTGKEAWTAKVDNYKVGHYMSLAPLVVDGKVLLGASGGELGVRGFLAAFDAETGKELWKTYTVPAPGEPGSETWPAGGDHHQRGGASIWITGTYDPETNLTFWGTGNGGPWFGDQRPGDNLFTSSVVAANADALHLRQRQPLHPAHRRSPEIRPRRAFHGRR